MRVFIKDNLVDLHVRTCDAPWELEPTVWPEGATREQIRALWRTPSFKGNFLHAFEGMSPNVAVSKAAQNRPVKLHCFVVDYDSATLTDDLLRGILDTPAADIVPSWVCRTSSGKGARLIWEFESAVTLANDAQAKAFLGQLSKRLFVKAWLPGLDAPVTGDPYRCFELGSKWTRYPGAQPIRTIFLHQWLWEASQKLKLLPADERPCEIPMETLAAEVERRFPGRWEGQFVEGARGIRFWDPTADNPTAAVVCPDGMLCFTGDQGFKTWKQIFGAEFVEQYQARKLDLLLSRTLWDEHQFWVLQDDGWWEKWGGDGFRAWLKCEGFSSKPDRPGGPSEIDEALVEVQARRRVKAALPFIFYPHGPMNYRGEQVLNTSRIRPVQPVEAGFFKDFEHAVKSFPFIWSFLSQFLELVDGEPCQLTYLLCWMKHFYESGLYQRPSPGQALVLAGEMSKGKTFFATALLARLMGGSGDGADYIVRGSQWTDQVAKWPVLLIDDPPGTVTNEAHQQFSALVKKMVANQCLSFNGKWMATGEVNWNGRVVICCNDDPESLRMLPNLDHGTMDKISLLRVSASSRFVFPPNREDTVKILETELPFFARFLLDWEIPEAAIDRKNTRYFLHPYRHPELAGHANRGSTAYTAFESIVEFVESYCEQHNERAWEGTATQLYDCLAATKQNAGSLGRMTPLSVGIALGKLKARGMGLQYKCKPNGLQYWSVPAGIKWIDEVYSQARPAVASWLAKQQRAAARGDSDGTGDAGRTGRRSGAGAGNPEAEDAAPRGQAGGRAVGADGGGRTEVRSVETAADREGAARDRGPEGVAAAARDGEGHAGRGCGERAGDPRGAAGGQLHGDPSDENECEIGG